MTLEDVMAYIKQTLKATISYELPRFPDFGVFLSPEHQWIGLLMKVEGQEYLDLKIKGQGRHLLGHSPCIAPYKMHSVDWIGIDLTASPLLITHMLDEAYAPYSTHSGTPIAMKDIVIDGYHEQKIPQVENRRLKQMHAIYSQNKSAARNFVEQARAMNSYRPKRQLATPLTKFKTLQEMNDDEIDTYYRLRKEFMQSHFHQRDLNYAKLFACELINRIPRIKDYQTSHILEEMAKYFQDVFFERLAHDFQMIRNDLQFVSTSIDLFQRDKWQSYKDFVSLLKKYDAYHPPEKDQERYDRMLNYLKSNIILEINTIEEQPYPLFEGAYFLPDVLAVQVTQQLEDGYYCFQNGQCIRKTSTFNEERLKALMLEIEDDYQRLQKGQKVHGKFGKIMKDFLAEDYVSVDDPKVSRYFVQEKLIPRVIYDAYKKAEDLFEEEQFISVASDLIDYVPHTHVEEVSYDYPFACRLSRLNYETLLCYFALRERYRKDQDETLLEKGYGEIYLDELFHNIDHYSLEKRLEMIDAIDTYERQHGRFIIRRISLKDIYVLFHQCEEPYWSEAIAHIYDYCYKGEKVFAYYIEEEVSSDEYFKQIEGTKYLTSSAYKNEPDRYLKLLFMCLKALQENAAYLKLVFPDDRVFLLPYRTYYYGHEIKREEIVFNKFLKVIYDSGLLRIVCREFDLKAFQNVLREIDRVARLLEKRGKALKEKLNEPAITQVISDTIMAYLKNEEEEKHHVEPIQIDLSSLRQIRKDAAITTEKLLTEEERTLSEEDLVEDRGEEKVENKTSLSDEAYTFLTLLLKNQDPQAYLKAHHLMASILAEEINEAMYDEIGDSVIDFEEDIPVLVEDYKEDIIDYLNN